MEASYKRDLYRTAAWIAGHETMRQCKISSLRDADAGMVEVHEDAPSSCMRKDPLRQMLDTLPRLARHRPKILALVGSFAFETQIDADSELRNVPSARRCSQHTIKTPPATNAERMMEFM